MTKKACPILGLSPSSTKKELASKPIRAPVSAASPPFVRAGSVEPSSPALESVVGWPSLSNAQPSGILPSWAPTGSMCHAAAPK